jgi:hypothetical protein
MIGAFLTVLLKFAVAVPVSDPSIAYSPYNWFISGAGYAQTSNPGAYLKFGFTGTKIEVGVDVTPLKGTSVPAEHYPLVRFSVDGKPAETVELTSQTEAISCAKGLPSGNHTLLLQYVAGYVFLDFWTPVNVLRVTGFALDPAASLIKPAGVIALRPRFALFLGDSITNGDDDVATFSGGITNDVGTQDATLGYPAVVAAGIDAEFGVAAYGGASWDGNAADGHTPGLMTSYRMLDIVHPRIVDGKLLPIPDDIFINMGENAGPSGDDVPKLLASLRTASSPKTNLFVIIPFSGRSRTSLTSGFATYQMLEPRDRRVFVLDLGNNPFLTATGPTMFSVDGQHPLVNLHAMLGAKLVQARSLALQGATLKSVF